MKREILVCDRCGQVFAANKIWESQWCRKCRAELHILEDEIRNPTPETPAPPSLEDMIREIVRQETT